MVPARYASTSFPGKPLAPIRGKGGPKPMIQRTYEQALLAETLDLVVVATDDRRIYNACKAFGAEVVMTGDCPSGTDRCETAVAQLRRQFDVVVNIQGDEPLLEPEVIDAVVRALQDSPDAVYSTCVTPMAPEDVPLRQRVKCIVDQLGYAIYFSRGVLPANKTGEARPYPAPFDRLPYLLHLGLQCYDRGFLAKYEKMPHTPLQLMEDLEQLKVFENGYKVKVVQVDHAAHGVDLPEDVASIEAKLLELGMD